MLGNMNDNAESPDWQHSVLQGAANPPFLVPRENVGEMQMSRLLHPVWSHSWSENIEIKELIYFTGPQPVPDYNSFYGTVFDKKSILWKSIHLEMRCERLQKNKSVMLNNEDNIDLSSFQSHLDQLV